MRSAQREPYQPTVMSASLQLEDCFILHERLPYRNDNPMQSEALT